MQKPLPVPKFKKPPYFRAGTLVFFESGHALGISGRHYRCLRSTHKKCSANGERQIKTETLERAFGRYAKKFAMEKAKGQRIAEEILKKNLWEILTAIESESESKEELMTATTLVMVQEAKANKKISQSDIKDFESTYVRSNEADYPLMLCGFILNFIKAASNSEKEAVLGRNLAILTKRVRLSREGKILELELEPWGWYTMNFIGRYSPNYLKNLKTNGVRLANTPNEFLKLPLHEAALRYGVGYTKEAMGQDMNVIYGLFKFVKDMFSISLNLDSEQMAEAMPLMFNRIQNDPALRIAVQSMSVLGIQPEPINPKEKKS
jgi:hypothetical protein